MLQNELGINDFVITVDAKLDVCARPDDSSQIFKVAPPFFFLVNACCYGIVQAKEPELQSRVAERVIFPSASIVRTVVKDGEKMLAAGRASEKLGN